MNGKCKRQVFVFLIVGVFTLSLSVVILQRPSILLEAMIVGNCIVMVIELVRWIKPK